MSSAPRPDAPARPAGLRRDPLRDVRPGDRLLVVVAHPDDESFGCGSVIARAAVRGAEVTVACATRGEAGDPAGAVAADLAAAGGDLGAVREAELRRAADRLGAARVELLGWRDSSFDGPPPAGSLCAAPVAAVTAALADLLRETRPHVVVVLDGSDGHRDHVRVRNAAHAAVRRTGTGLLYEHCLPNSLLRRWLEETSAVRGDDAYHALDPATLGRPDAEVTDVLDTSDVLDRRVAAMAEHRSQSSPFDGLSAGLRRAFLAADHLARVSPEPAWEGAPRGGAHPRGTYWDLASARWRS